MRKPIPSVERLRRRESERDKKRGERERERELFYNNKSTSGTRYQYIPRDIINYIYTITLMDSKLDSNWILNC